MRVRALQNIGGVVKAHAGEEFDISNEAQLQDLLQQGVVVPVENNPEEVAKVLHLSGEELSKQREGQVQERSIQEKAHAEAVAVANNKRAAEKQAQEVEAYRQAVRQAEQRVQQQQQAEQEVEQAEKNAKQQRVEAEQRFVAEQAKSRQATQQNTQSQGQNSTNQ